MRRYETIFILRPDLGEIAHKDAIQRFAGIVANTGGDLVETDEWGSRELAYYIKGERRGYYVRFDYGGVGATMNELERNLKLSDSILRYLSVLVDDSADMTAVRAEVEARHRRAAEARAAAEARTAALAAERAAAAEAQAVAAAAVAAPAAPEAAGSGAAEEPDATVSDDSQPDGGSQG